MESEAEAILQNISDGSFSICFNDGAQPDNSSVTNEISVSPKPSTTVGEGKPVDFQVNDKTFIPKTRRFYGTIQRTAKTSIKPHAGKRPGKVLAKNLRRTLKIHEHENIKRPKGYKRKCKRTLKQRRW